MTISRTLSLGLLLFLAGCATTPLARQDTGPWNLRELKRTPPAEWGARAGLTQEVRYESEPFAGKRTRVFAYLGRPAQGTGPFPAMVLVHGGGGKAFKEWAEHWAKRGYVALAMDTSGQGPDGKPAPDGGPDQSDATKFREFSTTDTRDMWTYHAVAAVIRGHSLLASLPEVDPRRIGITGISWGGYLTCIVAGLDDRLKVAVPVYGCGFLGENSYWKDKSLAAMTPAARALWLREFDPGRYLARVNCPILFLNGSNDFAYPMDSYRKSYDLVRASLRSISVVVRLPHGHIWTFNEVDQFVDSALRGGAPLPRLHPMQIKSVEASATFTSPTPLKQAELNYTTDQGEWQKREWKSLPAIITGNTVKATLPPARPLTGYLSVTDGRGLRVSTEHVEIAPEK